MRHGWTASPTTRCRRTRSAPRRTWAATRSVAFFDANDVAVALSLTAEPLVIGGEVLAFLKVDADMGGQRMTIPRIVDHIVLTEDGTRIQSLRAFFDYAELVPAGD